MPRRVGTILLVLVGTLAAVGAAAFLFVGRYDFGPFAAGRAGDALGRPVAVGGLRVSPGRWVTVDLTGARLDNAAGGSRPAMVEVGRLVAEVEAVSLLRGPVVVRRLEIDGLSVLLERTADGTPNWRFGPRVERGPTRAPADRSWFPTLLDARLLRGEVVFRTSSGAELRTLLDEAAWRTEGADRPVRLTAEGAYNGVPVRLGGDLRPVAELRDAAKPYGTDLRFASGDTTLGFKGTMTDPLNADGVRGELSLAAPTPGALMAVAGVSGEADASLALGGTLERSGDSWRLTGVAGALERSEITAGTLRLAEGARGEPDDAAVDLAFGRLDLNELLGTGRRGSRTDADVPLRVDRAPDTLLEARLSARELVYGQVHAADVAFAGALTPGRAAVDELSLTYLGAGIRASGAVEDDGDGGRVSVEAALSRADIQRLRRELGFGPVPLQGRLDARVAASGSGATLNEAARGARVSAVATMAGGGISREVIETASIDVRRLFRKPKGRSAVSCLLGVLDMEGGVGTVLPLRVRAADGTITGHAWFDLNRRRFDLTIGSQRDTTSFFALDVPVRVSGSFADPSVRPARWSSSGRAMLAAGEDVGRLPPELRDFARRSRCLVRR